MTDREDNRQMMARISRESDVRINQEIDRVIERLDSVLDSRTANRDTHLEVLKQKAMEMYPKENPLQTIRDAVALMLYGKDGFSTDMDVGNYQMPEGGIAIESGNVSRTLDEMKQDSQATRTRRYSSGQRER